MKPVIAGDGTKLYCEERGAGAPVAFVHELAGSCRSFDPQVESFHPRFRCIAFNARGYPPSEVPASDKSYSQDIAARDIAAVLDGFGIERAHLVGVSMGAASALQFALKEPQRVLSATLVGIGSGSDDPEFFRRITQEAVGRIETRGMATYAEGTWASPNRVRLKDKNPAEFRRSIEEISAMSALGHAVNLVEPAEFNRLCLAFMDEAPVAGRSPVRAE